MNEIVNQSQGKLPPDRLANIQRGQVTKSALLSLLVAWLSCMLPAQASDVLSGLSESQQRAITLSCTTLQFTEGTAAYRACLREELAAAEAGPGPNAEVLVVVSIDEQFAIQRACVNAAAISSTDYATCARDQLGEMNMVPEPQLSLASTDEQFVITRQCFQTQTSAGARAYRECINAALDPLEALPVADFASSSAVERNFIKLECSISSGDVAIYRKCILNALGIDFQPDTKPITVAAEPDAIADLALASSEISPSPVDAALPDETLNQSMQAALPDETRNQSTQAALPDETLNQSTQAALPESATPTVENDNNTVVALAVTDAASSADSANIESDPVRVQTAATDISQPIEGSSNNLLRKFTPAHWIALLAALTLPLMFFIAKSAQRPARVAQRSTHTTNHHLRSQSQGSEGVPNYYPPKNPAPSSTTASPLQQADLGDDLDLHSDQMPAEDASSAAIEDDQATVLAHTRVRSDRNPIARDLHFTDWLSCFDEKQQQEFCIEFLIYWMAYADNRYDPALKEQVFQMQNPDIRSLIKRWVFKKDAAAFAHSIKFLQTQCSTTQRRQIIDLLMALLVTEKALTPIQNNLLRFLADAFGIYNSGLNELFTRAFGYAMPTIPRPDKIIWWNQLTPEQKLRWDARAIAQQPDQIRYRIALGQPLKGDVNNKSVERSFNLAMRRCHPERVTELGEREVTLLETQKRKFEMAYDALLEPTT
ncbi:MAG: hypothetical protein AB8B97_09375 [Granulosicoccus sp.]